LLKNNLNEALKIKQLEKRTNFHVDIHEDKNKYNTALYNKKVIELNY